LPNNILLQNLPCTKPALLNVSVLWITGHMNYPKIWANAKLVCSKPNSSQTYWVNSVNTAYKINLKSTVAKRRRNVERYT